MLLLWVQGHQGPGLKPTITRCYHESEFIASRLLTDAEDRDGWFCVPEPAAELFARVRDESARCRAKNSFLVFDPKALRQELFRYLSARAQAQQLPYVPRIST